MSLLIIGFAHYYCITDCYLYGAFAFFGTFATYNFHRLVRNKIFKRAAIDTRRVAWLSNNRKLLIVCCALSGTLAVGIFFFLPVTITSLWILAGAAFVVGFYAIPIPGTNISLRQLSTMKNVWICVVWCVLLIIPLVSREKTIIWSDVMHVGLFAFVQIIPFDIRDVEYDPPHMRTVPQVLGVFYARVFGTVLMAVITASLILHHGFHWTLLFPVALSLTGLWWKQKLSNIGALELLWDGALPALGIFYYLLECIGG